MQRLPSTISAEQLQAWRRRHRMSLTTGAESLGISRRQFADYLAETYPIPRTVALLCACYDVLWKKRKPIWTMKRDTNNANVPRRT